MQLIDNQLLAKVSQQAQESQRLRMNYNFHDALDAPAQRLLNALQIGTDLPIHRHQHTAETYILLQGELKVLYYNDNKEVTETAILNPLKGNHGIHIPAGQWHTIEVLASDSVIFEVKDGPYISLSADDVLK
ncbi:WbuC family cupin fold metalloprotein [Bacteroides sp. 224]|uniref:WbuC family cupin fold metalloprotein n=1 Tax=Bacteroides sp. 224 TaxID=2302936 RepID=UPI0013D6F76A|nr:WbuC family cupin fold metalloprotein [Bacteroides sp. 224]NDV64960.1 cupin fold metalloprotein, WbuC family [Bacteroides sp. 224]